MHNAPALRRGLITVRQASTVSQPPSFAQPCPQQRSLCCTAPSGPMQRVDDRGGIVGGDLQEG